MSKALPILFWMMAIINLLPVVSAVMPSKLQDLYGIASGSADLMTLLQHRALLLGLIGVTLAVAAHMPELRWPALIGGIISMGTFVIFTFTRGQMSGPLGKIAMVDIVGLLIAALTAFLILQNRGG